MGDWCQTTSAYIVRKDYTSSLLNVWEKGMLDEQAFSDQNWKPLQQPDKWLMSKPLVLKQGKSCSDIQNGIVDYGLVQLGERGTVLARRAVTESTPNAEVDE